MTMTDRDEITPVEKPKATLKRCPDRRCVAIHTWCWLTDVGDPDGRTYICRPGAPS
jgi:hypothetical protein